MSDKINGGPAFPLKNPTTGDFHGMTLRDYFAAKAMQALVTARSEVFMNDREGVVCGDETDDTEYITSDWIGLDAYSIADRMLDAKGKGK